MADVYGNPVVDFWVDSTPPFPPAPRVTSVTASTVSFAWDAVADRGDGSGQDYFAVGVDHYDWSVQTGSTILQQGSSPDPVPLTAGGLAPAQDACVHVRAVDRLGNATGDQVVCGRTAAAATPPPLPPPPASGTVRVNPSPIGLTGLDAWLWLEPAPQQTVISWSQSGFTYTETETPVVVRWNFGDGAGATIAAPAGFGLAYPAQSTVTHRYERQAQGGYAISATVDYSIDWSASAGSVTSGVAHLGTVSSTTPALQYPVAQAQPELVSGG